MEEQKNSNKENRRKRKKSGLFSKILTGVLLMGFLAGLLFLLYPSISEKINEHSQSRAIAAYTEQVEKLDDTDYDKLWAVVDAYNERLREDEFRFHPLEDGLQEYNSLLNLGQTGIMGTVEIPKIDVRLPIYHGTDDAVLQIAVGHLVGSSLPAGGPSTHTVISGHRGLPSAKLFTRLDELRMGDTFTMKVLDRELHYQVDQIKVVLPSEAEEIEITEGEDYCTLVTCTPYGINSHRMLVRGHRIAELPEGSETEQADTVSEESASFDSGHEIPNWMPLLFAGFSILILGIAFFAPVKKKNKK